MGIKWKFWEKEEKTPVAIVSVDGERTAGFLYLTVAKLDENQQFLPGTSKQVFFKIPRSLRRTCNRLLAGVETPDDREVIETWVLSQEESKL